MMTKNYKSECIKLQDDIKEAIISNRQYFFPFEVEAKWRNCCLKTYLVIDGIRYLLSEIVCESAWQNPHPDVYSNIHVETCRLFRNLGIAGLIMECYKDIAQKEDVRCIDLLVSPMMENGLCESESLKEKLATLGTDLGIINEKRLNKHELIAFYGKHGFFECREIEDEVDCIRMVCYLD